MKPHLLVEFVWLFSWTDLELRPSQSLLREYLGFQVLVTFPGPVIYLLTVK
jgi:hypothetical protein